MCLLPARRGDSGTLAPAAHAALSGFSLSPQVTVWLQDTKKVQAVAVAVAQEVGEEVAVPVPVPTQVPQEVQEEQTLTPAPQAPSLAETPPRSAPGRPVFSETRERRNEGAPRSRPSVCDCTCPSASRLAAPPSSPVPRRPDGPPCARELPEARAQAAGRRAARCRLL